MTRLIGPSPRPISGYFHSAPSRVHRDQRRRKSRHMGHHPAVADLIAKDQHGHVIAPLLEIIGYWHRVIFRAFRIESTGTAQDVSAVDPKQIPRISEQVKRRD